jgi:iron complex outermembrane receptor protein
MGNTTFFKRSALAMAVSSAAFSGSPSFAQDVDVESNDIYVEAEELFLEELIVTAQKKSESIQDIPVAIAAFSDEEMNALGVTQSGELGQFVPGLEIGNSSGEGSQLLLFLRGAGLNDLNTNNAGPVGLYSDEVYVSSPALSPFQLFDAERVEVLKGPQGTIYGRNTTGGAVKFITKKPTKETQISGKWRFSDRGRSVIEAAASGALSKTVNARVAVAKTDADGYGTNLLDGSTVNGSDNTAYRALFTIEPNEDTRILVNVHGAHVDSPNSSFSPLGTLDPETGATCSDQRIANNECVDILGYRAPDNELDGNYNGIGRINLDSIGGYVEVDYDLNDDMTFTSVTSYDDLDRILPEESDGAPTSMLHVDYGVASKTFSQEFRLTGATDKFDWLAGVFYLDEEIVQDQTLDLFRSLRPTTGGLADPTGEVNGVPVLFARSYNVQDLQTTAIYGQANYIINDEWSITAGGRITDEQRQFDALGQLEEPETFGPEAVDVYRFDDLETSATEFSYRLGAEYRPDNGTLYYASVASGFKSGGFNGGFLDIDQEIATRQVQPFDPEFVTAYEVGMKADFFNSKMRLNASLFYNDFEDLQVFTLVNSGDGTLPILVLDNASNASSSGLELDFSAVLSQGLTANVNAAFIRSELENFVDETTGQDFSGNKLTQTPDTSVSAYVNYEYPLSRGGYITAQAGLAYKDDLFFSTDNNPFVAQEAYTLVSSRVAYISPAETWSVALYVNNLTDERYLTNVSDIRDFTGTYVRTYGLPRTYGLELSFDF